MLAELAQTAMNAMNIRATIKRAIRHCGFDIVRCPLPEWVALREHLLDIFSRLGINCVLDVGAHFGEYASFLRRSGYDGWILSFEPISDNFEQLQGRSAKDPLWRTYQYAFGDEEQSLPINVTRQTGFSSFLKPNAFCEMRFGGDAQIQRTERVNIKRLDSVFPDILSQFQTPRIYLKLDTQGYDLNVVKSLGRHISQIRALQTELSVHSIYFGMMDYLATLQNLAELGFEPTGLFPVTHDQDGVRVIEFDCVLVQTSRK